MIRASKIVFLACLGVGALAATQGPAQGFGTSKLRVTLQRRLPALVHLPSNSIKLTVTTADEDSTLPYDFQAMLETELLKDDPDLHEEDNAAVQIVCRITEYSHPDPTVTKRAGPGISLSGANPGVSATSNYTRYTGQLNISLQAKDASGAMLISDNISATYDQEFDSAGNSSSHGVLGSVTGTFGHMKGGQKSEDSSPPTSSELRSRLILDAVQQIAEHIVNTNESIDVFLAKQDGPLDEGDKDAQTSLWERALETFETAHPSPKPEDDAYRLYDIGVAYEALAYEAEDEKAAMKYLDQAAINYGKAIDAKPAEKYFIEPQKRIETAITHYKQLDQENEAAKRAKEAQLASANGSSSGASASGKGLTNAQVITMVKSGIDDGTIIQAIHGADAVNFDLTPAGEQTLTSGGVSARILTVMKSQAAKRSVAEKVHKGLSNSQVITMVKAGMDDDAVVQAIHGADAVDFDLSPDGQKQLTSSGVSARVVAAMKARALRRPTAYTRPVAER